MPPNTTNKIGSFQIGQIVYILSNKTTKIVPGIIAEEVIVKTLQGNKCQWTLFVGPEDKRKSIELDKIDGEIFSSIEEVEKELTKRLLSFISTTVKEAKKKETVWYKDHIKSFSNSESKTFEESKTEKVDLDDLFASPTSSSDDVVVKEEMKLDKKSSEDKTKFTIKMPDGSVVPLNEQQ